jgi:hypothetical protein
VFIRGKVLAPAPRKSAVSLPFNFGNYPILAISAISFAALSLRPSARTPPGGRSFVATKGEVPFDSLMTALSKAIFSQVLGLFWLISDC